MIKNQNLQEAVIYISMRTRGASRQIPTGRQISAKNKFGRLNGEMVTVYNDTRLQESAWQAKKFLEKLSKGAPLTGIGNNSFAIAAAKIPQVTAKLNEIDRIVAGDLEWLLDNYNEVKASELQIVRESLDGESDVYIESVMKRAEKRYPTTDELKNNRQLLLSITASPFAGKIPNIEMLKERIEDDITFRYKESVYAGLNRIYEDIISFWIRVDNGREVNLKSQNSFLKDVRELSLENKLRGDSFTDEVVEYVKACGDDIFTSKIQLDILMLNIYRRANKEDMLHLMANPDKIEKKLTKDIGLTKTGIDLVAIDKDSQTIIDLRDVFRSV